VTDNPTPRIWGGVDPLPEAYIPASGERGAKIMAAFMVPVSREQQNSAEVARRKAEAAERILAARLAKQRWFLAGGGSLQRQCAVLHAPVETSWGYECHGCDGCGDDYAEWPCRTWLLLAGEEGE